MCNNFNKKFIDEAAKAQGSDKNLSDHELFMNEAIQLAIDGVNANEGGPFGCVIVKDGKIIGRGNNKVISTTDPTAHAESIAIKEACKKLNSLTLENCVMYASGEPCPMCLGAINLVQLDKVYFGCDIKDAAKFGFNSSAIYKEMTLDYDKRSIPFEQIYREKSLVAFKKWSEKENRTDY